MRLSRQVVAETAFIFLVPAAAYYVFNLKLLNQDGSLDPWLYTGYAQDPKLLFDLFGWTYYGIRFPVVFLSHVFSQAFGPFAGYVALRYALSVSIGGLLFFWARRNFGIAVAVLSYLFLLCNPFFPRLLLWDYAQYLSVPLALAGMLIWYLPGRYSRLSLALVGFLFAAAIASHFFIVSAIGIFLLLEFAPRAHIAGATAFLLDILAIALGAVACVALGLLYMAIIYGAFAPMAVFDVLYGAVLAADAYTAQHSSGFLSWGTQRWYGYAPIVLVLSAGLLLRGEIFGPSIQARVWRFAGAYTAFYWFDQLVLGRFVVEVFYYFLPMATAMALLFPAWLALVFRQMGSEHRATAILLVGGTLLAGPVLSCMRPSLYDDVQLSLEGSILPVVFACVIVLMGFASQSDARPLMAVRVLAAAFLVGSIQLMVFTSQEYRAPFSQGRAREAAMYRAALDLLSLYQEYASRENRMLNWFAIKEYPMNSLAAIVQMNSLGRIWWETEGLPKLGPQEREGLKEANVRYVLAFSEDKKLVEAGEQLLRENGINIQIVKEGTLGKGVFRPHYSVIEILP